MLGGDLEMSTFGDMHASEDPAEQQKTMHATLVSPTGLTLMGADTPNTMSYSPGDNISVEIDLIVPIAMEKTQKFAIREGGRTIGAGRITEIIE